MDQLNPWVQDIVRYVECMPKARIREMLSCLERPIFEKCDAFLFSLIESCNKEDLEIARRELRKLLESS